MPNYLVTGANRGLGLEFVRQLTQAPSNTVIATVRSANSDIGDLQKHDKSQARNCRNLHILECDTNSPSSIRDFATSLSSKLGNLPKIDYLLNNAGANLAPQKTILDFSPQDLQTEFNTNVIGPALLVSALLPHLSPEAVIMNMSSGLGSCTNMSRLASPPCATYSISKAALNMLTVQQAGEFKAVKGKEKIKVIAMDPGWVRTRMGGRGAGLEAEDSCAGVLKVLNGLTKADSGKYFDYRGDEVPW
ncbi:hypothetical protein MMC09_002538 [Bachmanniomyces sp. S44760]|nr:hypothetical protein [Bachmanniomyces sp. S44760]